MKDNELHTLISNTLSQFPNLKSSLPSDYPRGSSHNITFENLVQYSKNREQDIWSHMNLPLTVANITRKDSVKSVDFAKSVLSVYELFCERFSSLPGFRTTISPLWKQAWNMKDPSFWSVFSECMYSNYLFDNGESEFPIEGFGRIIGNGKRDCDIKSVFNGMPLNFDIEVKNIRNQYPDDPEKIRIWVEANAARKMDNKFKDIPDNEFGIVIQVYLTEGETFKLFKKHKNMLKDVKSKKRNVFTKIFWLGFGNYLTDKGETPSRVMIFEYTNEDI